MRICSLLFLPMILLSSQYALVSSTKLQASFSKEDIRALYLKRISTINDKRVILLNLDAKHHLRQTFMREVIGMSLKRWGRYYDKLHFKGIDPPKTLSTPKRMHAYLSQLPNAIGYLPLDMVDDSHHILMIFGDE